MGKHTRESYEVEEGEEEITYVGRYDFYTDL